MKAKEITNIFLKSSNMRFTAFKEKTIFHWSMIHNKTFKYNTRKTYCNWKKMSYKRQPLYPQSFMKHSWFSDFKCVNSKGVMVNSERQQTDICCHHGGLLMRCKSCVLESSWSRVSERGSPMWFEEENRWAQLLNERWRMTGVVGVVASLTGGGKWTVSHNAMTQVWG